MVRTLPILPALFLAATHVAHPAAAQEFACAGFEPSVSMAGVAGKAIGSEFRDPSSHGAIHALVMFAKFRGEQPSVTRAPAYANRLFDPDVPGSLTHFYTEMSAGQLLMSGEALPRWYTSDRPGSAYQEPEGKGACAYPVRSPSYNMLYVVGSCWLVSPRSD